MHFLAAPAVCDPGELRVPQALTDHTARSRLRPWVAQDYLGPDARYGRGPHYCEAPDPIRKFATGYHVRLCLILLPPLTDTSLPSAVIAHLTRYLKEDM